MPGEVNPSPDPPEHDGGNGNQMVPQQSAQQPAVNQSPAPPWVEQMLQNQARDIELRGEQLVLAKQQEQHAYEFSQASLDAQVTDRREERQSHSGTIRHLSWMVILVIFLTLAFFGTLVLTGHETFALELAKVVVYGGLGAVGGWGAAKARKQPEIGE